MLLKSIMLAVTFFSVMSHSKKKSNSSNLVYICMGGHSTKYHTTKNCKGLQKCKGGVKSITINEAERTYKRTPCKLCKTDHRNQEI